MQGLSQWRPLARGGLAVVWEARQLPLDRLVAVKVYQRALEEDDQRRFLRDAAAIVRLSDHPGILTVYDAGILPDDRPYLVMELCPGGSLTQWLRPVNLPSDERVRRLGLRIADALAAAHACDVMHGDVKPANVLIDSHGNPRLADFRLAAVRGAEADAAEAPPVTPAYAAPEALRMEPATAAGDVFALAATLYALLSGSPPRDVAIAPIPGVDRSLMDVVMAALSNDPAARPTAAEFFGRLAKVPLRTSKRGSPDRAAEVPHRRGKRRMVILALTAALVTVIVSATAWLISKPASSGAPPATTQSATVGGLPSTAGPSRDSDAGPSTSTTTPGAGDNTGSGPAGEDSIQLEDSADSAKPFQTVRIQGTYRGEPDTFLRVQRSEGGKWLAFPLPTKTDQSGRFTAHVELGVPGRYRLRVLDPASGVKSRPFVLVIKG